MRIAYVLGTTALVGVAGIFGAGVYLSTPLHRILQEGTQRMAAFYQPKEQTTVNHTPTPQPTALGSAQDTPSKKVESSDGGTPVEIPTKIYVTPSDRLTHIESLTRDLVKEFKSFGVEKTDEFYSQARQRLLKIEGDVCQNQLSDLAEKVNAVIGPYQNSSCSYSGIVSCLNQLPSPEVLPLASQIYQQLSSETRDQFVKQKGLDFWLDTLNRNFGVHFAVETKKP